MLPILRRAVLVAGIGLAGIGSVQAQTPDPQQFEEHTWVNVTGQIARVGEHRFLLEYEGGQIPIRLRGWDLDQEADTFAPGSNVVVFGRIDENRMDEKIVDAQSVYFFEENLYYFKDPLSRRGGNRHDQVPLPDRRDGNWINAVGVVEAIDGHEFALRTERGVIQVDTSDIAGAETASGRTIVLARGDRVSVFGRLDFDLFENREIDATRIDVLRRIADRGQL